MALAPLPHTALASAVGSDGRGHKSIKGRTVPHDGSLLCRLELDAFDEPPRSAKLEAHRRLVGFSVWFWDDSLCPDGEEVARPLLAYNARRLIRIVLDVGRRVQGDPPIPIDPRRVRVTGERGFKADVLSYAWTSAGAVDWIPTQSDASFEFLHQVVETLNEEQRRLLGEIVGSAVELGFRPDILDLLERFHLPASAAGVQKLYEALELDYPWLRQRKERQTRRQARIAPFRQEIKAIAAKFSIRPVRAGGIANLPSSREYMTWFLEDYVVEHGRMPQGEVYVAYDGGKHGTIGFTIGTMDFDELRTLERWPPNRPDDPPHFRSDDAP
jgi:hypothetical protein